MIHTFTVRGKYYALDVESGAVHLLDKQAFDVLRCIQEGGDAFSLEYDKDETAQILSEISQLEGEGLMDSAPLAPPKATGEGEVKAMCLHIAHDCNLRCKYCFASTGDFCGERMKMPLEVAKKALDFLMERSGKRKHLEVDLFGGEPLMNFDVVKETVRYGRELEKLYSKEIAFTITTNCVALDDEKIDFINREMFNVVLSLDGRKSVHDALRPTVAGTGSYDIILPKAKNLVEGRKEGEYYVRGTFTNQNLDFVQDVQELLSQGFEQISIEPVVLEEESPYAIRAEHLQRIFEEYDALTDIVADARSGKRRWFNFFHFMLDLEDGPCLRKRLSGCGAGNEYIAVTPEGDIYPCHQFVGEEVFKMGSVLTGEFDTGVQARFSSCNVNTKAQCRACWAKYMCSGGCAANAYKYNKDIFQPHEISCELEKKRTECAIGLYLEEKKGC